MSTGTLLGNPGKCSKGPPSQSMNKEISRDIFAAAHEAVIGDRPHFRIQVYSGFLLACRAAKTVLLPVVVVVIQMGSAYALTRHGLHISHVEDVRDTGMALIYWFVVKCLKWGCKMMNEKCIIGAYLVR